jgi:hypothetical protein
MTTLIVSDVAKHFGEDYALLALVRVCTRHGEVTDAEFTSEESVAISFSTCEAAQAAFMQLNGFCLFGKVVSASFVPTWKRPITLSEKMVVENVSFLWAKVFFRRVKGVLSGPVARGESFLVTFQTAQCAANVAACLRGRCTARGPVLIRFVE